MKASLQTENSPFNREQIDLLARLLPTLTAEQMIWLGGYLAGLRGGGDSARSAGKSPAASATAADPAESLGITVLFGSQTGNAEHLAGDLARRLHEQGSPATLACMSEYNPRDLRKTNYLLVVVSTHGEGDPPDKALTFCDFLHGRRAPRLDGLGFAVLALGDISYEHFCQTGKKIDQRLEQLGGQRLHPRADCDVDYDESAEAWIQGVLASIAGRVGQDRADSGQPASSVAATEAPPTSRFARPGLPPAAAYTRSRPFLAEVLESINLNGRDSDKETRHIKLAIGDSGLAFEPGDSLGIHPQNHPELVESVIRQMGWHAEEPVPVGKEERPLHEALTKHYEITVLTRPLMEQAAHFSRDGLKDLVEQQEAGRLRDYAEGRDLLDLTRDFSLSGTAARDFVPLLRKMPPRLYSIASSQKANPDEVDLAVAVVRYQAHQRDRFGTCSVHCAERVGPGDSLPVYVHSNPNFRLPADDDAPIIMVGPGTGVAPFRAFIEEREELAARGRTWLFFGDRRFRTDFLYQTDWQRWLKHGVLTRMDAAFSRDTDHKVYVQDRMRQQGRELFAWLEDGAYFYVCGNQDRMAPDVHAALEEIIEHQGGMSREKAHDYVAEMQRAGRYQRDVY